MKTKNVREILSVLPFFAGGQFASGKSVLGSIASDLGIEIPNIAIDDLLIPNELTNLAKTKKIFLLHDLLLVSNIEFLLHPGITKSTLYSTQAIIVNIVETAVRKDLISKGFLVKKLMEVTAPDGTLVMREVFVRSTAGIQGKPPNRVLEDTAVSHAEQFPSIDDPIIERASNDTDSPEVTQNRISSTEGKFISSHLADGVSFKETLALPPAIYPKESPEHKTKSPSDLEGSNRITDISPTELIPEQTSSAKPGASETTTSVAHLLMCPLFNDLITAHVVLGDTGGGMIEEFYPIFSVRFRNVLQHSGVRIRTLEDLLNTPAQELLKMRNCGARSISDTRQALMLAFRAGHLKHFSPILLSVSTHSQITSPQLNTTYPLFSNYGPTLEKLTEEALNAPLSFLNLPIRMNHFLKSHKNIVLLRDLLAIPSEQLESQGNIGRKTLDYTREEIFRFNDQYCSSAENSTGPPEREGLLDVYIAEAIKDHIRPERNSRIYLERLEYGQFPKLTLEELGAHHNLTRERIRQIERAADRKILKASNIFLPLVRTLQGLGPLLRLDGLANVLTSTGKWSTDNSAFFFALADKLFVTAGYPQIQDSFLITVDRESFNKDIQTIAQLCDNELTDLREPIPADELLEGLREKSALRLSHPTLLGSAAVLEYISSIYQRSVWVVNGFAYNEMTFQVHHGRSLTDVVESSLRYLGEPCHFRLLAEFIRANNTRLKDNPDQSIYSTLLRMDQAVDVDRGIYTLKEFGILRRPTAWEAIVSLITERGPQTEDSIFTALHVAGYLSWNIKMALENNRNKFIRIGNDLIDLRSS